MPLIVARYLDDDAFTHHTKLDQAVREERITAAAAVPLPTGPRIIGALIAANRDERTFSLSDVELLRILGAHAALAIDRVAVAEERDQALMSLQSDNLELTRGQAASVQVHNTLARVLLTGTQLSDLVTGLVEIIEGQLAVFDRDVRMLAEAGGFTPTEHTDELVRSAAATHLTQTTSELAAVPVTTTTGLHGVLCLRAPAGVTRSDIQVIERAVVTAAILLLRAEAEAGAAGFRRDDFINDLVSGKENPAHLMQRAAKLKFDVRSPYTIHVVRADLQDRRIASLAHEAARPKNGLAGLCHRMQPDERPSAVVLLPGEDARKNSLALAEAMRRASDAEVSVAGAGPVRGGSDVRRFFEEAHACSDAMLRLSGYRLSGTMDDLGFLGLVLGRDKNIHAFVEGALAPVVNYDAEHRTELLHTLDALLSTDGGPTAAAELLHVHVSTVKQRMQRLQRLLGDDWRSVDRTLELRLAMKLHRIGVGASS
ncbi:guanylate cyclase [Mycobacterium sp. GA-2829]|nr:guanylate cyclase [Mycobacterium sp. GA-2829]